jgi:atypical dual specificity phosphatase
MTHLRLPTTDHFEPSVADLQRTVDFIRKYEATGSRVYVHCRAGHGRSAAAVLAWLLEKSPDAGLKELNEYLCSLRNVRSTLWKQPNIREFHSIMRKTKQPPADESAGDQPLIDDEPSLGETSFEGGL